MNGATIPRNKRNHQPSRLLLELDSLRFGLDELWSALTWEHRNHPEELRRLQREYRAHRVRLLRKLERIQCREEQAA